MPPIEPTVSEKQAARTFIDRVREQRLARNWSQAETARRAGLSLAAYKRFEGGFGNLTLLNLVRLMGVLGYLERFAEVVPPAIPPESQTLATLEAPRRQRATAKSSLRRSR